MHKLPFRQVHLDFHTSPDIAGIGKAFNKKEWQKRLKDARVNSITIFSKCHHGWSYHPTKVGKIHPHLSFDLLKAQYEACEEIGVKTPIYLSAGLDDAAYEMHPEWRERDFGSKEDLYTGFKKMCFNSPYLDYLCEQIKEVVKIYPNSNGIFLDIIWQGQCCCPSCMALMKKHNLNPELEADRKKCAKMGYDRYYRMTTDAVRAYKKDYPVFHNSGHITPGKRDILKDFSHLELESLPTGGWGYDHFPISAKYAQTLGLDFLGMTGKFHTTWGEFGGYKHPNALRYECAAMLAFGAKCSIGDQLHPDGKLDPTTYATIGAAYKEVEAKEKFCDNVENVADIALLSSASTQKEPPRETHSDTGASRILLEGHFLFDVIDTNEDFSKYKMIIFPDDVYVSKELKKKTDKYLKNGGKIMLTGSSGMNEEKTEFLFDIGADYSGLSEFRPDYVLPEKEYRSSFMESPMVMYFRSARIKAKKGKSIGEIYDPYFNRNIQHFCSHQHAPNKPKASGYDAGTINGNILYVAHPVFTNYYAYGAVVYKDYLVKLIKAFAGASSVETSMPSTARLSLMQQKKDSRYILHLLYANTISRGAQTEPGDKIRGTKTLEVIEELMPLTVKNIAVKLPEKVTKVVSEPDGKELKFRYNRNLLEIEDQNFECHKMIVLHYGKKQA